MYLEHSLEDTKEREDASEKSVGRALSLTSLDEDVDQLSKGGIFLGVGRRGDGLSSPDDLEDLRFGGIRLDDCDR